MAGFNFGTPSTTSTPGGMFGSGTAGSTPGFAFGSPAPTATVAGQPAGFMFGTSTPASTGTAPGFNLGNTASAGGTPGFSLGNTGAMPGATPGTMPASTSSSAGFSFNKPGATGVAVTPGLTGFGATAVAPPGGTSTTPGFSLGAAKTTAATGFSLGAQQTSASGGFGLGTQQTSASGGFGLGTQQTLASGGFALGTQQTSASGGFALGTTPSSGALAGLLGAGQSTATTQTGGTSLLASLTQPTAVGATATPTLGGASATTTSSLFGVKTPAAPQASTGLGLSLGGGGLKLGVAPATAQTTTTGAAPSGVAPSVGFGISATTSAPAVGFGLSTASATSAGSLGFAPALSTATSRPSATTGAVASQKMSYKQLEEQINKWMTELEDQERLFLLQATQVNAWDRLLVDNGEKITQLNGDKERVKVDQNKLEQELDFIKAQQRELEELLIPMEKSLEQLPSASFQQHADLERENTYQLSYNIDAQLKRMVQDLKEIIDHLNSSNSTQDTNDPILQITMILNAHMDSLQWIDTNTALVGRRVEDISKQMESQRKDQERNFRLVYD